MTDIYHKDWDVAVVGAGIIGLSAAFRLRQAGLKVVVFDKGAAGREASWAGGGILTPITPHKYPPALAAICRRSNDLYPALVADVEAQAGMSVEFRSTGLLRLGLQSDELDPLEGFLNADKALYERLTGDAARDLEPQLSPAIQSALLQSDIKQVRNPRLLKALLKALQVLKVPVVTGSAVTQIRREGETCVGIETLVGAVSAKHTVLAAGAWSGLLLKHSGLKALPVKPIHGEMILLETQPGLLNRILIHNGLYIIPRADGRVLIGSTMDDRGFHKQVQLKSVERLLRGAIAVVPALGDCEWKDAWAGLRPSTPDRLPYIGKLEGLEGLVLACGHYRNGLMLAAATAEAVVSLLGSRTNPLSLEPYRPDRPLLETG